MSQPRYIRAATASVTKALAWCASAKVYGPGRTTWVVPFGEDLCLDDAGRAVVDGAQHGDHLAVLSGVADEQLVPLRRPRCAGRDPIGRRRPRGRSRTVPRRERCCGRNASGVAAFTAACATVSRSAKPSILTTSLSGRAEHQHGRVLHGAVGGVQGVDAVRPHVDRTNALPARFAPRAPRRARCRRSSRAGRTARRRPPGRLRGRAGSRAGACR